VCRAPSRWVAGHIWGGGKFYRVVNEDFCLVRLAFKQESSLSKKIMRVVIGVLLSLPGQIISVPLMLLAYTSKEIRLKHQFALMNLTDQQKDELHPLIHARQPLEKQRCEGVSVRFAQLSVFCTF
jgi:hypothetical protein